MRYGSGMGAEMKPIYEKDTVWDMVKVWQLHINPSSMGKLHCVKIHTLPVHWIGMAIDPHQSHTAKFQFDMQTVS